MNKQKLYEQEKKKIKVYKLTDKEKLIVKKVEEFKAINGRYPKLIEVSNMMGYKRPCTAHNILFNLECKGYDYRRLN